VESMSMSPRSATDKELGELITKAVQAHKDYSVNVMNGNGMDRHLLGLKLTALEHDIPLPKLFSSDAYKRLTHFQLSTSQVPTRHVLPMGFGPSAPDCYGACYNPMEKRIFFTITAFNSCTMTSAAKFADELQRSLLEMRDMLDRANIMKMKSKL